MLLQNYEKQTVENVNYALWCDTTRQIK